MDGFERVTRGAAEVVTESELETLLGSDDVRAYVGYEPSGVLHVGHLLTANALIELQAIGVEVTVLLADVHAYLNEKGSFEEIQTTAEHMEAQFLAYGLSREHTKFVYGSEFQLEEDYVLDLHSLAREASLARAERAMAEIQGEETTTVAHVLYPLMQALDIEYLDVDIAVGGMEQRKVHMLARDTLPRLGYRSPTCLHTPLIADLQTGVGKMSSSAGPTLSLADGPDRIRDVIDGAYCPPTADPEPDEDGYDRHNPILQLYRYHVFPRQGTVTVERPDQYGGDVTYESYRGLEAAVESGDLHPADAKAALADALDELFAPGRQRLRELQA